MRYRFIFILILFLIPDFIFAAGCSKFGYTINTVNGVFTSESGAKENRDSLKDKLPPTYQGEPITFDYLLNPSHLAGLGDILASAYQKYFDERAVNDYDLVEMIKTASDKVKTQKLLLVAHSQGNFYGNSFYDTVVDKPGGVPKESIGIYGVASPATRVAGGGLYLTSDTDQVMNKVKGIVGWILQANTHIELKPSDGNGHSFSDVYLKYQGEKIVSDIQGSLNKLSANNIQNENTPCISPPKLSLLHKTQGVVLAVADPLALGTKKTAQVAYAFGASVRDATSRLAINMSNLLRGSQSATVILADNNTNTTPPNLPQDRQTAGEESTPAKATPQEGNNTPPDNGEEKGVVSEPNPMHVTIESPPPAPSLLSPDIQTPAPEISTPAEATPEEGNDTAPPPSPELIIIKTSGSTGGYSTPYVTPYETPYTTPYETPYTTPYETPYVTPYATPYVTPYATPYETPYSTPYATPYATPAPLVLYDSTATYPYTPPPTQSGGNTGELWNRGSGGAPADGVVKTINAVLITKTAFNTTGTFDLRCWVDDGVDHAGSTQVLLSTSATYNTDDYLTSSGTFDFAPYGSDIWKYADVTINNPFGDACVYHAGDGVRISINNSVLYIGNNNSSTLPQHRMVVTN